MRTRVKAAIPANEAAYPIIGIRPGLRRASSKFQIHILISKFIQINHSLTNLAVKVNFEVKFKLPAWTPGPAARDTKEPVRSDCLPGAAATAKKKSSCLNHASVEPRLRLPLRPSTPPTARPSGLPMDPWSKTQICAFRGSLAASDSKHDCMAQFLVVEALDSPQQVSGQDGPLARGLDTLSVSPNSSHAVGCSLSLRRFPVCSDVPWFSPI